VAVTVVDSPGYSEASLLVQLTGSTSWPLATAATSGRTKNARFVALVSHTVGEDGT
jgi:hypothetical protein